MNKNIKTYESEEAALAALQLVPANAEAVARYQADSARRYQDSQDSFDRCDTDGFLSQWASNVSGDLAAARARLAEHGNMAVFPVLVDSKTGECLSAHLYRFPSKFSQYGRVAWRVNHSASTVSWVSDYKRASNFAARGLRKAWAILPAKADFRHPLNKMPEPRGLSGCCSVHPVVFPDYSKID